MPLTTTQQTEAYRFFAIAFNAAPGVEYMNQIAAAFEGGASIKQIVNEFTKKSVFTNAYPIFLTNEQFAARLIDNVVGAAAADAAKTEAKADVVAALAAGSSRGDVIFQIFTNLAALTGDAKWGGTAAKMANQVAVSRYYTETLLKSSTDIATLQAVLAGVDQTTDVTAAALETRLNPPASSSFVLTTGVDSGDAFKGGAGNDVYASAYSAAAGANTLGALDVLDGGAGNDTLRITNDNGAAAYTMSAAQISNIENITIRGSAAVTADTSGSNVSGVTSLSVTQAAAATLTAAATTDVSVSGATGAISVDGGKNVVVSAGTAGSAINVGATTAPAGTVSITDTAVGAANITVRGGTDTTIVASGSTGGGANTIAAGSGVGAKGAVSVSSAHTAVAGTNAALNAITVNGGTTVTVAQTADTSKAATDKVGSTLTLGSVTVTGNGTVTSVTSTQPSSISQRIAVDAVAGVTESASVKFTAMTAGQTLVIAGLTFTASTALTAAEAAAAFANLAVGTLPVVGDTQGAGPASKGTYTGVLTGWTSGAVSTDTVVFTSTSAATNVADLTNTGTAAATITTTAGSGETTAVTGRLGVVSGAVTVNDAAGTAASITNVSLTGYAGGSTIGNTGALSKLGTLSLTNSGSAGGVAGSTTGGITVNALGVSTLALNISNVRGAVDLSATTSLKTLNISSTGLSNSGFSVSAASVETLSVSGSSSMNFSTSTLSAVKSLTTTNTAGTITLSGAAATLESVNTTGATGAATVTIDGGKATYTGGAGVDSVTLATTTALTKAINLGAGNDTLSFSTLNVTGSTAAVDGGDGTDTLRMSVATADNLDNTKQTFYTNFERLRLDAGTADATINLSNLNFTDYVTTSGTSAATTLTLDKMVTNGTVVVLGNSGTLAVGVNGAADSTTDVVNFSVLNQSTSAAAETLNVATLTAAEVETVNLTATDSFSDDDLDGLADAADIITLTLTANKATAVNLGTSSAILNLTLTGSTRVTSIDGSAMTGRLNVTSQNTTSATTIKGGAGRDALVMATGTTADTLIGGAGNDKLTANAGLGSMTGGTGADLFVVGVASANVNSYSTITDFSSDDLIELTGIGAFKSAKVTLGDTAVFQDYANAAILALGAGEAGWFQFGGNTYIVADMGGNGSSFTNGEDFIVKINGLVDLTNATFNDTYDTVGL